jgi:hypothetical protein
VQAAAVEPRASAAAAATVQSARKFLSLLLYAFYFLGVVYLEQYVLFACSNMKSVLSETPAIILLEKILASRPKISRT